MKTHMKIYIENVNFQQMKRRVLKSVLSMVLPLICI